MRLILTAALILACATAQAVQAQPAAPKPAPAQADEALAAKLAHDAEIADQDRRSEALNVEINRKNRDVEARNAATRAAFDKAMADYKAAVAQHDAQVQAMAAEDAKTQAAYQKAMDDWKAAVAACKAGDFSKCQTQAPPAPGQAANAAPAARTPSR